MAAHDWNAKWWLNPNESVAWLGSSEPHAHLIFRSDDGTIWRCDLEDPSSGGKGSVAVFWDHQAEAFVTTDSPVPEQWVEGVREALRRLGGLGLGPQERELLDATTSALRKDEWVSGRRLRRATLNVDREHFHAIKERMQPRWIREDVREQADCYSPTFSGLLCSGEADAARAVIENVIAVLRRKSDIDPDVPDYTLDEVVAEGSYADEARTFIMNVISLAALFRSGDGTGNGKEAKRRWDVPTDVEEVAQCGSFSDFLNHVRRGHPRRPWPTAPLALTATSLAMGVVQRLPAAGVGVTHVRGHAEPPLGSHEESGAGVDASTGTATGDEVPLVSAVPRAGDRGRYALVSTPIGVGGYAEVFEATDKSTGGRVAFKRARRDVTDARERLVREIQIMTDLAHPNVMALLDSNRSAHPPWYVMPLAVETLERRLSRLDEASLSSCFAEIAEGLRAAHRAALVHRDVTPRNVLWLRDGGGARWVVADWGVVRRAHGQTTTPLTSSGLGTAGFAAPETWIDAHSADERADVYSLGRVIAWATTGKVPVFNEPLTAPGKWHRLVEMMTEKDRNARPKNMDEILDMLAQIRQQGEQAPVALVALGRHIVAEARVREVHGREWTLDLYRFLVGTELDLLHFGDTFNELPVSDRYLIVEEHGDGRILSGPPRCVRAGSGWTLSCSVESRAPRTHVDQGATMSFATLKLLKGAARLPQLLEGALSFEEGEWFMDRRRGTRVRAWFSQFGDSPIYERLVKLEATRLAAIPYEAAQQTPWRCVERVVSLKLHPSEDPTSNWRSVHVVADVAGLGRWESDLKLLVRADSSPGDGAAPDNMRTGQEAGTGGAAGRRLVLDRNAPRRIFPKLVPNGFSWSGGTGALAFRLENEGPLPFRAMTALCRWRLDREALDRWASDNGASLLRDPDPYELPVPLQATVVRPDAALALSFHVSARDIQGHFRRTTPSVLDRSVAAAPPGIDVARGEIEVRCASLDSGDEELVRFPLAWGR